MSQNEFHTGRLVPVDLGTKSLEESAERICRENNISEISSYNETWLEELRSGLYEKYFVADGVIYEMVDHSESEDSYFVQMTRKDDGSISFTTQFYNGGTCLSEVVEESISQMNKMGSNDYRE